MGLKGETLCICFDVPSIDSFLLSIFKYFSLNLKSGSPLKSTLILILNKWTHAAILIFGPLKIFKGILFRLGTYSTLFMGCELIEGELYCVDINLVTPTVK